MSYCFKDDKSKVLILDAVYPIGSIYMSVNSTSPEILFGGGTWEQIKGRFLVAQGNNGQSGNAALNLSPGATGGETNHQLTVSEMPSHSHGTGKSGKGFLVEDIYTSVSPASGTFNVPNWNPVQNTGTSGGGTAHNNLPPYLAVYMWKRTA